MQPKGTWVLVIAEGMSRYLIRIRIAENRLSRRFIGRCRPNEPAFFISSSNLSPAHLPNIMNNLLWLPDGQCHSGVSDHSAQLAMRISRYNRRMQNERFPSKISDGSQPPAPARRLFRGSGGCRSAAC